MVYQRDTAVEELIECLTMRTGYCHDAFPYANQEETDDRLLVDNAVDKIRPSPRTLPAKCADGNSLNMKFYCVSADYLDLHPAGYCSL